MSLPYSVQPNLLPLASWLSDYFAWAGQPARSWENGGPVTYGFSADWTAPQQAAAIAAMTLWSDLANITFTAASDFDSAQLQFEQNNSEDAFELDGEVSGDHVQSASITIDTDAFGDPTILGDYGFSTVLHEIGHALGLGHGGPYNSDVDSATEVAFVQDSRQYTVMSYIDAEETGADFQGAQNWTPALVDIIAIHDIYGVNQNTRIDNTTYGFHSTAGRSELAFTADSKPVVAIYDAGGTDTLDLSGFAQNAKVSLVPGRFSNVGGLKSNLAIAFGTQIENAIGGSGNDSILGNDAGNVISGGLGNDTLQGGAGADTLDGGGGHDTAVYVGYAEFRKGVIVSLAEGTGHGADAEGDHLSGIENLQGSAFSDKLIGDAGDNALTGGKGSDILDGGQGADTVQGDEGHDMLDGGLGNDSLAGGADDDVLEGGLGNDSLAGGAGDDVLEGGAGADRLDGGDDCDTASYLGSAQGVTVSLATGKGQGGDAEGDRLSGIENLEGSAFADSLVGDAGDNALTGNDGADTLDGGKGDDRLLGYEGDDLLSGGANDDSLDAGNGNDRLQGGDGDDWIVGGAGADRCSGGQGSDTFAFDQGDLVTGAQTGGLMDQIIDFRFGDHDSLAFYGFGAEAQLLWMKDMGHNPRMQIYEVRDASDGLDGRILVQVADSDAHLGAGDYAFYA